MEKNIQGYVWQWVFRRSTIALNSVKETAHFDSLVWKWAKFQKLYEQLTVNTDLLIPGHKEN